MGRPPIDFARQGRRSRLEARILNAAAPGVHLQFGKRKAAAIGAMTGTVVEIGAGTGVNMGYYAPGVHLIAIEPNPHMHAGLRQAADAHGVDLEIRGVRGERIDLDDETADGVVGTLVLCGVDDPDRVVSEVLRILKPGKTYFFLEHVAAPSRSWTRRVQTVVKRPHRWLMNGCDVERDTAAVLQRAGFDELDINERDAGPAGLYVRHQIVGTATRPSS